MAPSATIVRRATGDDVETIAQFNVRMAQETEDTLLDIAVVQQGVQQLLDRPSDGFYMVAEVDRQVVGVLLVTTEWSDWHNGYYWWIQSVYVTAPHRRAGIFRSLYRAIQRQAESDANVRAFRLYVERDNLAAQSTYRALGMEQTPYLVFEEKKRQPAHTPGSEGTEP